MILPLPLLSLSPLPSRPSLIPRPPLPLLRGWPGRGQCSKQLQGSRNLPLLLLLALHRRCRWLRSRRCCDGGRRRRRRRQRRRRQALLLRFLLRRLRLQHRQHHRGARWPPGSPPLLPLLPPRQLPGWASKQRDRKNLSTYFFSSPFFLVFALHLPRATRANEDVARDSLFAFFFFAKNTL